MLVGIFPAFRTFSHHILVRKVSRVLHSGQSGYRKHVSRKIRMKTKCCQVLFEHHQKDRVSLYICRAVATFACRGTYNYKKTKDVKYDRTEETLKKDSKR